MSCSTTTLRQEVLDAVKAEAGFRRRDACELRRSRPEKMRRKGAKSSISARRWALRLSSAEPETGALDTVQKLVKECGIKAAFHNHPAPSKYWDPNGSPRRFQRPRRHGVLRGHRPLDAVRRQPAEGPPDTQRQDHLPPLQRPERDGKDGHDVVWGTGKGDTEGAARRAEETGVQGRLLDRIRMRIGKTLVLKSRSAWKLSTSLPWSCRSNLTDRTDRTDFSVGSSGCLAPLETVVLCSLFEGGLLFVV